MSDYGQFKVHNYKCDLDSHNILRIRPFGDVHRDARLCDNDRWKKMCDTYEADNENALYLGMGDYNDFLSWNERKQVRDLHESTIDRMDKVAYDDTMIFYNEIKFMKGKLIGLIDGNHTYVFKNGQTATELLCELLGCEYLSSTAYIRINPKLTDRGSRGNAIDIFACHGKGSGQLLGATINKVEQMNRIFPSADIYIQGHDHKKGALPKTVLECSTGMHIKQKRQWYARSGSFLRGYVPDEESYVLGRLYPPTDLGVIQFDVKFSRVYNKGIDVIVKDIHCRV